MQNLLEKTRSFMETFNTRDFSAMIGFFSESGVYIDPHGIEHNGVSAIGDALAPGLDPSSDVDTNYEVTSMLVDEATSTAFVTWTLLMVSIDGAKTAIDGIDMLRFRDGKIVLKNAFCKARELVSRKVT